MYRTRFSGHKFGSYDERDGLSGIPSVSGLCRALEALFLDQPLAIAAPDIGLDGLAYLGNIALDTTPHFSPGSDGILILFYNQ